MPRSVRKRDLIGLVEAFYQPPETPKSDFQEWAASLCRTAAPLLDHGHGVVVRLDRIEPPQQMALYVETPDPELRRMIEQLGAATSQDGLRMYLPNHGLSRLSEIMGPLEQAFEGEALEIGTATRQRGAKDWVHLSAADGTGYLVVIAAAFSGELQTGGSPELWKMVCAHLSAAFRLQRQRRELLDALENAAIFDVQGGRFVHADGRAKRATSLERIRATIREVDRARTGALDAEMALRVWEGLVDGTWSVVDRHDHDGRRFVIAVPNDPCIPDPRGLTTREAQVAALASLGQHDKLIAYTLGLERSTISTHLHNALRKLGVRDRIELASVFTSSAGCEAVPGG